MNIKLKTSLLIPALIIVGLVMSFCVPGKTYADVALNPADTTGAIPDYWEPQNNPVLKTCDSAANVANGQMNYFPSWISPKGDPDYAGPIHVPYGDILHLQLNSLQVNCHDASPNPVTGDPGTGGYFLDISKNFVTRHRPDPSVPGNPNNHGLASPRNSDLDSIVIDGQNTEVDFLFGYGSQKGNWSTGSREFDWNAYDNGSYGFKTSGKYILQLWAKTTVRQTPHPFYDYYCTPFFHIFGIDDYNHPQCEESFIQYELDIIVDKPGCMNPASTNYDPTATVDDGSCNVNQLPNGRITASCSVSGVLTVSVQPNDPDGGNMNIAVYIPNVGWTGGPTGGIPSGSTYNVGSWGGQPQDGVTKSIDGAVYDAQTGAAVDMVSGLYTCPRPLGTLTCPAGANVVYNRNEFGVPGTVRVFVNSSTPAFGFAPVITGISVDGSPRLSGLPANPAVSNPNPPNGDSEIGSVGNVTITQPGTFNVTYHVSWSVNGVAQTQLNCGSPGNSGGGPGGCVATDPLCSVCPVGDPDCIVGYAKPYLKSYGSDVWAGGQFGSGVCANPSGRILAHADSAGGYHGSSGQFGVGALLNINGFYSSSQRNTPNTPPRGSSFANTTGTYGGNFGASYCFTDYSNINNQDTSLPGGVFTGNFLPQTGIGDSRKQRYTSLGGGQSATSFGGFTVRRGEQAVIYINGDVTITGNITYQNNARNSANDIPFFMLVVKGGNIRIAPGVTVLDGVYVAEPTNLASPGGDGKIYTCYPAGGPTSANLYDSCNSQLVVNGALIAQQVKFFRTFGSLHLGVPYEPAGSTSAAEVINYSPEIFMAPSPLKDPTLPSGSISSGPYDAIFSLPPVF